MGNIERFYSKKYLVTPQYQLKEILIALRKLNGISLMDMAEKIGVPTRILSEYEKNLKPVEHYEAVYIEVLKDYVSACKERVSFEDALRIYMNQKGLMNYNISYKVTLLGNIMYDYVYANMDYLQDEKAFLKLPCEGKRRECHLWNDKKYSTAFYLLGTLRKLLDIDIKEASANILSLKGPINAYENSSKDFERTRNVETILREYSDYLTSELEKTGTVADIYEIICRLIESKEAETATGLKLGQLFLDEIYK